jgi:protein-S-isoprenylcysteine O-methyltransferase Ste14
MNRPDDTAGETRSRHLGSALVGLQFGLIAVIAWLAYAGLLQGFAPAGAWFAVAAGALLGLWALLANPPGNFNIRPTPRKGGRLIQSGPYHWIRHPMYSCVMLCAVAGAWVASVPGAWLAVAALGAVLVVKASLEERWMSGRHASYAAYRARTKRFIPGVF